MTELDSLLAQYEETTEPRNRIPIMVVDDDPGIGRSLSKVLKDYEVILATSGQEALEKINPSVSCVIMDAKMPVMDGFTTSTKIWERYPNIPIIMHTAFHGEHKTSDVVSYHFFAYVEKGSDIDTLKLHLKNACESYTNKLKVEEYQRGLERMVEERTAELREMIAKLEVAYGELDLSKKREDYLNQQLRIRDLIRRSEDLAARILHENKNLLQPIGNLIERNRRLIETLRTFVDVVKEISDKEQKAWNGEGLVNLQFLADALEKSIPNAHMAYKAILTGYEDFRQVYNPRETGINDLNRDLEACINLMIDRNYRSFIEVIKDFGDVRVPVVYESVEFNRGVFMDIIKNARDAIEEERSRSGDAYMGKILVKTFMKGGVTFVSVYDNGVGVREGQEEKIFEKMETTKNTGTGLGLYTARFILNEKQCGRIYYEKSDMADYKTKMVVELNLS